MPSSLDVGAAPVAAGILVGGGSRRMGFPKQFLIRRGSSLAARTAGVLAQRLTPVVIVGSGPLPADMPPHPIITDVPGLQGPVAGMTAALRSRPARAWLFAPCDLPTLSGLAVAWLLAQRGPGVWAVLPHTVGGPVEPLLALYEPEALTLLEVAAAAGRPPWTLASHPMVVSPEIPARLRGSWANVNTPEEAAAFGLAFPPQLRTRSLAT